MKKPICICSLSTHEIRELALFTAMNQQQVSQRHGLSYHHHIGIIDNSRHPSWSKLLLVAKLLNDYHRVLWVDADVVLLKDSPEAAIDHLLSESPVGCFRQPWSNSLNFGIAAFESGPKARAVIASAYFEHPMAWACPWWEQEAFVRMEHENRFTVRPFEKWVDYPDAPLTESAIFAHAYGPCNPKIDWLSSRMVNT